MLIRTAAPQFKPPIFKPFVLPEIVTLSNGVDTYIFNSGDQAVFKVELIFSAGSYQTTNPAIPSLCMEMLREGSSKKTGEEINKLLDYYGSFIELKAGLDHSTVDFYGRSEFLDHLLPLLAEIILDPIFNNEALEHHKQKMAQNIRINQKKTSYWSGRLLRKSIFGEQHPYSNLISVDDIANVSATDLKAYHQKVLVPGLNAILIAGSFNSDLCKLHLDDSFGRLQLQNNTEVIATGSRSLDHLVSKSLENTNQASIAIGCPTMANTEVDYPTQSILVKILGGYFGSRLMKTLREDKGLTYGVHAYTYHLLGGSYLQIAADVELKSVDYSIELIFEEVENLRKHGVSQDELSLVKNYMIGEYVNDSNTVFDFATLYNKIIMQNLPPTYYEYYYGQIAALKADTILDFANELLTPADFYTIKVV